MSLFFLDCYRWAVSSVMTRQNQIPTEDGSRVTLALIPLWDMCNHTSGLVSTLLLGRVQSGRGGLPRVTFPTAPLGSCVVRTGRPTSGHSPHRPSQVVCSQDGAACPRSLSPPPLSGHVQSEWGGLPRVTLLTASLGWCAVGTGQPASGHSPYRPSRVMCSQNRMSCLRSLSSQPL